MDFPCGSDACSAEDPGSIPALGRSPGGGHGNPFQYSCLGTEEPGGLQSMGSQRVRHNWATKHSLHLYHGQSFTFFIILLCLWKHHTERIVQKSIMTSGVCMLSRFSRVWLCDPVDCSLPGFSVHGIPQARMVEWVAISSSRGSSDPGIKPESLTSPALAGGIFTTSATGKPPWLAGRL